MAKVLKKLIQNWQEYYTGKVYIITEDMVTVTTDATKGVAPYNTSYGYTNIDIDANAGIVWEDGAAYIFVVNTEMVVSSAYRNVRVRIGTGAYIPMKNRGNTILAGSSYMVKGRSDLYIYKKTYETNGALHLSAGSDTTYSAMSVAEWKTGKATSSRVVRADYLKQIIEYYIEQNAPTIGDATITLEDQNGNEIGTFTTNATADKTITINTGGGGGTDGDIVAAIADAKLGNFDNVFKLTWLYKVLNAITEEDELGLTAGDTREDIVASATSMSLISHSYAVMVMIANSSYAMDILLEDNDATKEISECWNSISIIWKNSKAKAKYLASTNGQYYYNNYTVVQNAFA